MDQTQMQRKMLNVSVQYINKCLFNNILNNCHFFQCLQNARPLLI